MDLKKTFMDYVDTTLTHSITEFITRKDVNVNHNNIPLASHDLEQKDILEQNTDLVLRYMLGSPNKGFLSDKVGILNCYIQIVRDQLNDEQIAWCSKIVKIVETMTYNFDRLPYTWIMNYLCISQIAWADTEHPVYIQQLMFPATIDGFTPDYNIDLLLFYMTTLEDMSVIFDKGSIKDYVRWLRKERQRLYPNKYNQSESKFISSIYGLSRKNTVMDYFFKITDEDFISKNKYNKDFK